MKYIKGLIALIVAIVVANSAFAQKLDPLQVIWKTESKTIPINEAKDGVDLSCITSPMVNNVRGIAAQGGEIALHCVFQASDLCRDFPDGIEYVVKWYHYMSTRKMLMSTSLHKVSYTDSDSQGMVTLVTNPKLKLRNGWWEVVILSRENGDTLRFAGNSQYQIYLK